MRKLYDANYTITRSLRLSARSGKISKLPWLFVSSHRFNRFVSSIFASIPYSTAVGSRNTAPRRSLTNKGETRERYTTHLNTKRRCVRARCRLSIRNCSGVYHTLRLPSVLDRPRSCHRYVDATTKTWKFLLSRGNLALSPPLPAFLFR